MSTSKSMPSNGSNVSDRTSTFILGRRAHNFSSHNPNNVNKNIDYSSVLGKPSSIIYGKPLNNTSSDLRIQRLRLSTIGIASTRIKNNNDLILFFIVFISISPQNSQCILIIDSFCNNFIFTL